MLFNSFPFLIFFVVATVAYYAVNFRWKWLVLLLASCYFYAYAIPAYLLVLFLIIAIDFLSGILIEPAEGKVRKMYLAISILSNLTILAVFKYHNFFVDNINFLHPGKHYDTGFFSAWNWALPIGLSFHTFQAMSYTIEVYRGNVKAERHPGIYALYVLFYPQLVAGPIERPQQLLPQFRVKQNISYDGIAYGLKLMLWGFYLKVVVADRLAIYVNYVYRNVADHSRSALLTSVFFYSFQIYCDFAGYSIIALGAARVLGINLSVNFRRPYLATSIREFWKRWNISLSSWFRDYVYHPMGGSRVPLLKFIFNILVVFILSGLWHGANWTFILWGLLHAVLFLTGYFLSKYVSSGIFSKTIEIMLTFILVSFAWILFRSPTIHEAVTVIRSIFDPSTIGLIGGEFDERVLLIYSVLGIISVAIADICREYFPGRFELLHHSRRTVRLASCVGLIIVIVLFGVFDGSQFIYFQF